MDMWELNPERRDRFGWGLNDLRGDGIILPEGICDWEVCRAPF
jgi:hypothetical protein